MKQRCEDYRGLLDEANMARSKAIPDKVYSHEFHSHEKPIFISPIRLEEYMEDLIGPEQVSPHYENFSLSRRISLLGIGGLAALSYISRVNDLDWVARSMIAPWLGYFMVLYFFFEGRRYMLLPLQNDWYCQLIENELSILYTNAPEDIATRSRESVALAMEQLEYLDVHEEFQWIKQHSIGLFLEVERERLQQHLRERSLTLLKSAETFEKLNRKHVLEKVLKGAFEHLEEAVAKPNQRLLDSIFAAGLKGIEADQMTYQDDTLLIDLIEYVGRESRRLQTMSSEE